MGTAASAARTTQAWRDAHTAQHLASPSPSPSYGGFGGGAHYTMAGSKQFQKGVRVKGVVSRHSVQGARLGAARRGKAANGQNQKAQG